MAMDNSQRTHSYHESDSQNRCVSVRYAAIGKELTSVIKFREDRLDYRVDAIEQSTLENSLEITSIPLCNPDNVAEIIYTIGNILSYVISTENLKSYRRNHKIKLSSLLCSSRIHRNEIVF